jgi:hypothetical protein
VRQHIGTTLVCSDGANFTGYKDGVSVGTTAVGSAALPNSNLFLLRSQTFYGDHPLAVATFGAALTADEAKALHEATMRLMIAVGAWEEQREVPQVTPPARIKPQRAPAIVVDFQTGEGMDLVTYARTGATTALDQNGHFATVAEDVIPITHDPLTGRRLGMQTCEEFTNQEANSQLPSDASYVKSALAVATASGVIGLDGTTSGVFTLTADGTLAEHSISRTYAAADRYICPQVWLKLPGAASREQSIIALRVRDQGDDENWIVLNNANRQTVTFGPNIIELGDKPRAGIIQTADERYQLYIAVDLTTASDVDPRVSLVMLDPTYPMDGSDPAAYAVNEVEDVTNLLGWQVTWIDADPLEAYPRPYAKTTGSAVTVNRHSAYIDLSALNTGGDLWVVVEADVDFMGPQNATLARWEVGASTYVGQINASSTTVRDRLNSLWAGSGVPVYVMADAIFDGSSVRVAQGRSVSQLKTYRASNNLPPASLDVTSFTGNPEKLYLGHGGTATGRHLAATFRRVEVYTSRPLVSELRELTVFQGGFYASAPFLELDKAELFALFQPFLGITRYNSGTDPDISRALQSAYNSSGTILGDGDNTAYCAAWLNYMYEQIGLRVPATLWAADYIQLGVPILDPADWQAGDVLLITQNGSDDEADRVGHVAILWEKFDADVVVIGGNHNGSQVGFAAFPLTSVFGARRITEEFAA